RGEPRFGVDRAPLGPVVAALVPRCALLPAPTPRMMGLRRICTLEIPKRWAMQRGEMYRYIRIGVKGVPSADSTDAGGGGGKECAASLRAEQRLAPGGRSPHNPDVKEPR